MNVTKAPHRINASQAITVAGLIIFFVILSQVSVNHITDGKEFGPAREPTPRNVFSVAGELRGTSGVALRFCAKGNLILTADERACRVWDAVTLRAVTPLLCNGYAISDANIDRQGDKVLTWGATMKIGDHGGVLQGAGATLWRVKDSKELYHMSSQNGDHLIWNADLSSDGTRIATCADGDKSVCVWDATTGKPVLRIDMEHEVQFVMFSPDGERILAFQNGRAAARQWDAKRGVPIGDFLPSNSDRYRNVSRPGCYSSDGRTLVLAVSDRLYVYDAIHNQEIANSADNQLPSHDIFTTVDGSGYGGVIAATSYAYGSRAWESRNCAPLTELVGDAGSVPSAISPDGKIFVTGGPNEAAAGFWDTTTGQRIQGLPHVGWFERACFSPSGILIALSSRSPNVTCIVKRAIDDK